ncbi:hypothetical protein BaRGS_00039905, partial [Batillaria attramentaria]
ARSTLGRSAILWLYAPSGGGEVVVPFRASDPQGVNTLFLSRIAAPVQAKYKSLLTANAVTDMDTIGPRLVSDLLGAVTCKFQSKIGTISGETGLLKGTGSIVGWLAKTLRQNAGDKENKKLSGAGRRKDEMCRSRN